MKRNKPRIPLCHKLFALEMSLYILCFCSNSACYNLDENYLISFTGPDHSLFGYSVLLHAYEGQTWILVGAPVSNSSFDQSVVNPGSVYKCGVTKRNNCEQIEIDVSSDHGSCGRTCQAEFDGQWLGVSLAANRENGHVLACGHRWKNVYYSRRYQRHKLPHGVCYKLDADLTRSTRFIPCYKDFQQTFAVDYNSCQAGMSNFLIEDLIVIGAPGTSYWTGTVLVYNMTSHSLSAYLDNNNIVLHGSYLGYSVGAGHFTSSSTIEVVGGAPQHEQTGKAYIFKIDQLLLEIIFEARGKTVGSYFGASVCAVDLNSDGLADLMVGAPMHSDVRDEGRVYVYMNHGAANMHEEFELQGSNLYVARFGEAISNLGDINDDGFPDVAIGAPQEEELHGAVYIYNGKMEGISQHFSQRIAGRTLGLKMFGQSVSGGTDVDSNGYPDVAVGAFLSDTAVVLRSRAVVQVVASLLLPASVNSTQLWCIEDDQPTVCINATVCFSIRGRGISKLAEIEYHLAADVRPRDGFPVRFYFSENGTLGVAEGRVSAHSRQSTCTSHWALMASDVRDTFTPVHFELKYSLDDDTLVSVGSGDFPYLTPVLQQPGGDAHNMVTNKTEFARHCLFPNCSANLQLSAHLLLPRTYKNMSYFALGSRETVTLHVELSNMGDEAFLPKLHLRFPSNVFFIKALTLEDVPVSCDPVDEEQFIMGVDCSVGLYMNPAPKLFFTFMLDVEHRSRAGDLNVTIYTTCISFENEDLLYDNSVSVALPLRHLVDLSVHGFVSPAVFVVGERHPAHCITERFNYTFMVQNIGPSTAPDTRMKINIPTYMVPYPYRMLIIVGVETSRGVCHSTAPPNVTVASCDLPHPSFFDNLFFFLSKTRKRHMYCPWKDPLCWNVVCNLGDLASGQQASVIMEVELNPAVLEISPGRERVMLIESLATASPRVDPYVLTQQEVSFAKVTLEAHYNLKPQQDVAMFIVGTSLVLGLLILAGMIFGLWNAGFFKRKFHKTEVQRESWDYVPKSESTT